MYRVVQESLTNAVKYGTGQATTVRVGHRGRHVEVEVINNAAPVPLPAGAKRELSGGAA